MPDMKQWLSAQFSTGPKRAIPILSFPCVSLMGVTVRELVGNSKLQAEAMYRVAQRVPSGASVSMMDLSVEAEAFGSQIRFDDWDVPTVIDKIVHGKVEADALAVPRIGMGRTGCCLEAISQAANLINDRPVFAGMIGPYSLAGRLMGVSEIILSCYDEAEMVRSVMEKATDFLIDYARAYREAGASGIIMAEPLTGLLSPSLAQDFSEPYVARIVQAAQDEAFPIIYHNCGNNTYRMLDSLLRCGAAAYHFGNGVSMRDVLSKMPSDVLVMGNLDPAGLFCNGSPQLVFEKTQELLQNCGEYPNFVISSGCDIPPATPWENIDAFFRVVDLYER